MQLHAVIVPPAGVVQEAVEAAKGLFPTPPPPAEQPRPGLLDRLRGRRQAEPDLEAVATLSPAAAEAVFVRLAKFGNVTATDAASLAEALQGVADTWRVPVLHVSRVRVAEEHPFDVSAELDGDVDALREIFRNVHEAARLHRFFLDRRSFRSELVLGTAEVEGDAEAPVPVAGREVAHRGAAWAPTHVTLLRTSFTDAGTTYAEVARIELADGAEELDARTGA